MNRNRFLKTSSALFAGGLFPRFMSATGTLAPPRTNWSGNYVYKAPNLHEPGSIEELQTMVRELGIQKALGSRHCFNDIADSPLNQISMAGLNRVVEVNKSEKTVTVEGGIRYGDLAPRLVEEGLALHNLASLPHISVAGACATATHGSGRKNGNLATAVAALEIIRPDGERVQLRRGDADFNGAVVNLGALGMVSQLTLDVEDNYLVRQDLFQDLPQQALLDNFDRVMSGGYSVSLFTDYLDDRVSQVWVKRKATADTKSMGQDLFGALAATRTLHPLTHMPAENVTDQLGVPGPWHMRLPHFKMGFTPSSGDELQSEFFVPVENGPEAYLAVASLAEELKPHLMISEIRAIAADDLWLSTAYGGDKIAFHFTWHPHEAEVMQLLPKIERVLAPYGVRPHWGKLFTLSAEDLHGRTERIDDFLELAGRLDPERKLHNDYLDRVLFGKA